MIILVFKLPLGGFFCFRQLFRLPFLLPAAWNGVGVLRWKPRFLSE
nr:MAG TPA: hypothetical protein [Caudoviricetes sp.]